jgi:photosynthetic reaction center cytochrome c subunit
MMIRLRRKVVCAVATAVVCALGPSWVLGQATPATPAQKPQMSDEVFKNVQVLKGIPIDQFMDTMGFFAASLSLNCTDCHTADSGGDWAKYADDTDLKRTARQMILMVTAINKNNFRGARMVTCYTCHRGGQIPKVRPSLTEQYGVPPAEDPNEVIFLNPPAKGTPTVDQVLDNYVRALGGSAQLAKLTSFVAKGTYEGYDTEQEARPVEIYAKAPGLRTTVVHYRGADSTRTYDGHAAWIASPDKPVSLLAVTGGDLDSARLDAIIGFPALLKQSYARWKVGMTQIDDKDVIVLQGTSAGLSPVNLYFDKQSGLLVRKTIFTNTMVGQVPTQVDYSDYRPVAGVRVPFSWIATWTDGQDTTKLTDVQPNVPIAASKFSTPAPVAVR